MLCITIPTLNSIAGCALIGMELDAKLILLSSDDKKETILDRCKIIDVCFHCTELPEWKLHSVTFRNFYSYSVSLLYKFSPECEWTTLSEEKRLMPHSGSERGSQDVVVLNTENCCLVNKPSNLRIVLKQPCENWKDFGLCDLKCIGITNTDSVVTSKHVDGVHRPSVNAIQRMLSSTDYMDNYNITYLSPI